MKGIGHGLTLPALIAATFAALGAWPVAITFGALCAAIVLHAAWNSTSSTEKP